MKNCYLLLGNIKTLLLSGNLITQGVGLDRLWSLEKLSLDSNRIDALEDIVGVSKLPCLMDFDVKENPLCLNLPTYRVSILNLFRERRSGEAESGGAITLEGILLPTLDGLPATRKELNKLKDLTFTETLVSVNVEVSEVK